MPVALRVLNAGPSERGWHRLESVLRCPQLFAYRHLLFPEGGSKRAALVRGSLGHVGLAHHYALLRAAQRKETSDLAPVPTAMRLVAKTFGELGEEMLPVAEAAVSTYLNRFHGERLLVEMVEQEVRARVCAEAVAPGRSFLFTQRIDLAFRGQDGRYWITDHKFVAKPSRATAERYALSGQFLGYQWFGRQLWKEQFGGVIVNLVGCVPPYHIERAHIPPAPAILARFPQIVADAELTIERLAGRDPWHYPCAANEITCAQVYGECCEFWELCQWGKSSAEPTRAASLE